MDRHKNHAWNNGVSELGQSDPTGGSSTSKEGGRRSAMTFHGGGRVVAATTRWKIYLMDRRQLVLGDKHFVDFKTRIRCTGPGIKVQCSFC